MREHLLEAPLCPASRFSGPTFQTPLSRDRPHRPVCLFLSPREEARRSLFCSAPKSFVTTGRLPAGSSSMTEQSRSPYNVSARDRGIGVAVMTSTSGIVLSSEAAPSAQRRFVLLVNDHKPESPEPDAFLDKRVRADDDVRLTEASVSSWLSLAPPSEAPSSGRGPAAVRACFKMLAREYLP